MSDDLAGALRPQFLAALEMLESAVRACPDDVWADRARHPEVWYLVFHTLFWLDLYLHGTVEGFRPPEPFGLQELDPAGLLPDRVYGRAELLAYLAHGRARCRAVLDGLTAAQAARRCRFGWGEASFGELLVYNLRHVQHGVGQLNLLLRQATGRAPGWVARVAV